MQLYVFGYGSLMNPQSLARTVPSRPSASRTRLRGYQRKFNKKGWDRLYLNIVPKEDLMIEGALIPVTEHELALLKKRERGYACVDVTNDIAEQVDGVVYAFIAPDNRYPKLKIYRSYIETCLAAIEEELREQWLAESVIENDIEEDIADPKYRNAALDY